MPEPSDASNSPTPYREPDDLAPDDLEEDEEPSWWRDRLEQRIGGRPLILYLVIIAGVGALVLLLVIIIVSATKDDHDSQANCLDISPHDAVTAIFDGQIDKASFTLDNQQSNLGPVALTLTFKDGAGCRTLPQGIDNRDGMLQVLGALEYANDINGQKIRTDYERKDVPVELLSTATPTPTAEATLEPTGTVDSTVAPTAEPTLEPTATAGQ